MIFNNWLNCLLRELAFRQSSPVYFVSHNRGRFTIFLGGKHFLLKKYLSPSKRLTLDALIYNIALVDKILFCFRAATTAASPVNRSNNFTLNKLFIGGVFYTSELNKESKSKKVEWYVRNEIGSEHLNGWEGFHLDPSILCAIFGLTTKMKCFKVSLNGHLRFPSLMQII